MSVYIMDVPKQKRREPLNGKHQAPIYTLDGGILNVGTSE